MTTEMQYVGQNFILLKQMMDVRFSIGQFEKTATAALSLSQRLLTVQRWNDG